MQATTNPHVQRSVEAKIREAEQSLAYFTATLLDLQRRKLHHSRREDRPGNASSGRPQIPSLEPTGPTPSMPSALDVQSMNSFDGGHKAKVYNSLDLIKADTPHTPAKISRMLHQLEFKHQVELQYKKGIDKMVKLYQADGDKKSRADAESKKFESEKKIQLLRAALKRYKNLHILDVADEPEEPSPC